MIERRLTIPEIMLIAGTRVALGAGIGFLVANRLNKGERKAVGWALFLVGAASSIPLVIGVLGKKGFPSQGISQSESRQPSLGSRKSA